MAEVRQFRVRSPWIEALIVRNFKSLAGKTPFRVPLRPLTLLSGANSSGKSSTVQPLLLLKQTLEADFDPGPLLLNGPHLNFSSTWQIHSRNLANSGREPMEIGAELESGEEIVCRFQVHGDKSFELVHMRAGDHVLSPGVSPKAWIANLSSAIREVMNTVPGPWVAARERCFLSVTPMANEEASEALVSVGSAGVTDLMNHITRLIHVAGLRGNPQQRRSHAVAAVGTRFPGRFEPYVASILQHWQEEEPDKLKELGSQLEALGLTWKVQVRQPNASELEVSVGRLPHARRGGAKDLVNIADVGFGVSQTLPVLVALLTAEPGQLVFLEQPEIHLHPKAQVALAEVLAAAAKRGVRVIAETHSILLLTAVQALVAEGRLPTEDIILHWFERNAKGVTEITTRELDAEGRYGDWPEDFADTEMAVQSRYLDAAEKKMRAGGGGR